MKKTLSLILASTALTASIGLPAFSAMRSAGAASTPCADTICAALLDDAGANAGLIRVSGDDDDDDDSNRWFRRGHDDDDDECEDDDDDDGGVACNGGRGNPAPAGSVAPPANGLFGNGAPPVATTN